MVQKIVPCISPNKNSSGESENERVDNKYVHSFQAINSLRAIPTKWSNTLNNLSPTADELFECV